MLSKSVKTKRRHQAASAAQIEAALWAAVPAGVGEYDGDGWPPCHTLNEREGMKLLGEIAQRLARYPKGSKARQDAAFYAGTANVVSALGHYTPESVLRKAGLL